jgi:hypothetical protein
MTISEIASKSGYSRQRLNRLVDLGYAKGIERKANGRLAITNEVLATQWCEFLLRRKTERKRRNAERKEKRDLLKIRLSPETFQLAVNKVRQGVAVSMGEDLMQKLQREFKGDWRQFEHLAKQIAQAKSREVVASILPPIPVYRTDFALRGRRPETKMAREALFDFALTPAAIPWIKSFSDIAREYGCTRAAISAMAKKLPTDIPRKSGRYRRA